MDFFDDDNESDRGENTHLPLAIQPQRPLSSTADHKEQADEYGSFESSSGSGSHGQTEASAKSSSLLLEQPLISLPLPPPPKPAALLSATQPPYPSAVAPKRRQSADARKNSATSTSIDDVTGQDGRNVADQILYWISERHPQQQQQEQNSIDTAWQDAEGLMGGGEHMHIHIGEIATRLCSVLETPNDTDTAIANNNDDDEERDRDGECDDYNALLSVAQPKSQHAPEAHINDPQKLWDAIWRTPDLMDEGDVELPFPQDNPNGDLVKAYLQLAELSNKQLTISDQTEYV